MAKKSDQIEYVSMYVKQKDLCMNGLNYMRLDWEVFKINPLY